MIEYGNHRSGQTLFRSRLISKRTIAVAVIACLVGACGPRNPSPEPHNLESHRSKLPDLPERAQIKTGPFVPESWIRNLDVMGVHLGMDAAEARNVLSRQGEVRRMSSMASRDRPMTLRFSVFMVKSRNDISGVNIYTFLKGKREVVSGIVPMSSTGGMKIILPKSPSYITYDKDNHDNIIKIYVSSPIMDIRNMEIESIFCDAPEDYPGQIDEAIRKRSACSAKYIPESAYIAVKSNKLGLKVIYILDPSTK